MAEIIEGGPLVPRGTGGAATIINNAPLLNSLHWLGSVNESRRIREQEIEARKAIAQAKIKEDVEKPYEIPIRPGSEGELLSPLTKAQNDRDFQELLAFQKTNPTRQQTATKVSDVYGRIDDRNYQHNYMSKAAVAQAKQMEDMGINAADLPAKVLSQYHNQLDADVARGNPVKQVEEAAWNDVSRFNTPVIAKKTIDDIASKGEKITLPDGSSTSKEWSQIRNKDGTLNYDLAKTAIERYPAAKQNVKLLADGYMRGINADPAYAKATDKEKRALAERQAHEDFLAGFGTFKTEVNKQTDAGKALAKAKSEKEVLEDATSGVFSINVQTRTKDPFVSKIGKDGLPEAEPTPTYTDSNYTITTPGTHYPTKKFTIGANQVFFPIGQWDSDIAGQLNAKPIKEGSSIQVANKSFDVEGFTHSPKVPVYKYATADAFKKGKTWLPGQPISDEMMKIMDPEEIRFTGGTFLTPRVRIPNVSGKKDDLGQPSSEITEGNTQIFIPDNFSPETKARSNSVVETAKKGWNKMKKWAGK